MKPLFEKKDVIDFAEMIISPAFYLPDEQVVRVDFHADGGQMCVDGIRLFTGEELNRANSFILAQVNEVGHNCIDSVGVSFEAKGNSECTGMVYPMVAGS